MLSIRRVLVALSSLSLSATLAAAVDVHDTRLLSQPAISARHVAFVYAGDLWLATRDGGAVHRVTSHVGDEVAPCFSPDGETLAFSAEYDGNLDVFAVPVAGGTPRRLTWHPAPDVAQAFTPDGTAVLFISDRNVYTRRYTQLFTVALEGGLPTQLPIPYAARASYAPDGHTIGYNPIGDRFRQWKNYRGGTASRIWLYDRRDHSVEEIPRPPERSNDVGAMWVGDDADRVYFLSDRDGEFNLFAFDRGAGTVTRLTDHRDFPIISAAAGAGVIVYEQAGYLHLYDPAAGTGERLVIGVAADLVETRARYVSGAGYVRSAGLSPSGARAVFELRGEIVTVPAKKGDARNLTASVEVHERSPVWSPDGARIAYFSDAGGEYQLHVAAQDGKGEVRTYALDGAGFYEDPKWSPDGTKISFSDNSWSLYWIDLERGVTTKVASEQLYGPVKTLTHNWSPDSRWLVYTLVGPTMIQRVYLYHLEEDRSRPVTDGLSEVSDPVFDQSGKYLYFLASTDAGPARTWFAQSNADMELTRAVYLAVLAKGTGSPLAKESDEEAGTGGDDAKAGGGGGDGTDGDGGDGGEVPPVVVDFDGLDQRILALPLEPGAYANLQAGTAGKIYYLHAEGPFAAGRRTPTGLDRYDFEAREATTLMASADEFVLAPGGGKVLVRSGTNWHLGDAAGGPLEAGAGGLEVDAVEVRVDPPAEWRQIYHEAWRINRDYFYDPGMHGADWPAMRQRYAPFLDHLTTRDDLNRVIQWLCSELAVGHHRVAGGDDPSQAPAVGGGLLGADYQVADGRYRLAKVYGGLNWNPELRAPLTEPGVEVVAGEYLLAVEGEDLRPPENLYRRFENTAGKIVELTVGPDPAGAGARTVQVVPIDDERALRNRDWVEGNLRRVEEATGGRVAYVYVPNTAGTGHAYFKRYFFPQADRPAIIIDERHNGGGQVADYYIDILRRPLISYWATRYGGDIKTPLASIQGPKVMLIDETAGSGGDLLPWMFRQQELGTLVGKATWGGLVGVLGFPVLMDGGFVTAPNLGIWTPDGGFIVENVGVPPDIEVEQWPAELVAGRDPQLEKAIAVALEALDAEAPPTPERPPFPVRARRD